jgi:predicted N-acetyltransferase YhbS
MSALQIEIRPFQPKDAGAFRALNEDWITKQFGLEQADRLVLEDPEGRIIGPGGHIFMAFDSQGAVGCCALLAMEPGKFQLAKMTVAESHRGRGIGRKILTYAINEARLLGAKSLFLGSNAKLADAVHLYEAFGFRHLQRHEIPPSPYTRANVFMELAL